MPKKKLSFQQALERLEEVVDTMEQSETSLEELIQLYKEGIDLSVFCGESLHEAEKEVSILQQMADGVFKKKGFVIDQSALSKEAFSGDLDD